MAYRLKRLFWVFVIGVSLALPAALIGAPAQAGSAALSGAQIKRYFAGRSYLYCGRTSGWVRVNRNGTARLIDYQHGRSGGRWWIKGRKLCRQWSRWPKIVRCSTVTRVRKNVFRSGNGFKIYTYNRRPALLNCAMAANS